MIRPTILLLFTLLLSVSTHAQDEDIKKELQKLQGYNENLDHKIDRLEKLIDDVLWYNKVGDIAHVDKLYIYGPPKWKENNPFRFAIHRRQAGTRSNDGSRDKIFRERSET